MFTAINISDESRVTSIATRWDDCVENLRELARGGQLVCPGCAQLLWLRTGEVRRRHFAHRDVSDCKFSKQSPELLEAKAQIFTWLDCKFPGRVQMDLELGSTGPGHHADLVVQMEDGRRFIYWIFDRQMRDRSRYRIIGEDNMTRVHYLHTESTLRPGPDGGILLNASQREFISTGDFDQALKRPQLGHLHFFLGSESQLHIYRGLRCLHEPLLHEYAQLRTGPLENALVCTESGEIIFPEDVFARKEYQRVLALNPQPKFTSLTATRMDRRAANATKGPNPADPIVNYSRPLRCEDCGAETRNWSQAKLSEGTCVCKECSQKRWINSDSDLDKE